MVSYANPMKPYRFRGGVSLVDTFSSSMGVHASHVAGIGDIENLSNVDNRLKNTPTKLGTIPDSREGKAPVTTGVPRS